MKVWLIAVMLSVLPLVSYAGEVSLRLNNGEYEIPAIANLPDSEQAVPAVVLLHGTASHKNEVGNLYVRLAAALADVGIGSIRIDFAGTGDSEVSYRHYTLESAVRDATVALNYMQAQPRVNAEKLGVVGFSQGGLIAQLLIAQSPVFDSFVAWSSVASDSVSAFRPMFDSMYQKAKQQGYVTQEYTWRAPLDISLEWFEQVKANKSLTNMATYNGALLAIAGSADKVVPAENALRLIEATSAYPAQAVIIKDASHIFNVLNEQAGEDEQLLQLTVQWFAQTLL
ncbi:alpha/beta hydrolase family protein [Alteromonas oceani]|uniref:Alpha/beta hydrolase family protein n=1 Tax=Alteromonas oceani TaxID=2071609 RepID=A0ABV7JSG0_9ALTE|nr:alpha/beta fold hydrolase [Alteromonas oceani]